MNDKSLKDHRQIGQEQDLFVHSELVGSGLPLFTPKGTLLRKIVENYMYDLLKEEGYEHVWSPHIARKDLFEVSGHLEKFSEDMFPAMKTKGREYVLKAMNCPHHIQIYQRKPISYKEMPQRYAEIATVYRSEQSGELGGLTRVMSITMDDAHIFIRKDQIKDEFKKALDIDKKMLKDFGFKEYWIRLSLWDPKNKTKYLGDEKTWEEMQRQMRELLKETKTPFKEVVGEAAFYGPKMDLMAVDSHGREWQLSTIQLDFNLPERFKLSYVGEDGKGHMPYIIHRATLGAVERFLGVWLEHVQGILPLWLSPVQITLIPIADRHLKEVEKMAEELKSENIRVEVDSRAETMQNKIRQATLQKVPYMGIIGDKEINDQTVSVRTRDGKDLGKLNLSHFVKRVKQEIDQKT
ncbi:MAG: threonine--tRNA ligase [Candidatus Levybacteria bacterium RBG_16_35_11]|nr:MAG: threonine--tRNA ligase [Candidatus Levybacteria bacterium RBG_16_35_11]